MTTLTDDQIIRDLTTWATKRGRVADPTVLGAVLSARPAGRRCDPSVWRPGEVQEALLAAVAADPCLFLTDADVLRGTLDSFFRFLRNTGRLHSTSADVAVLCKEAARAARTVEQAVDGFRRLWACPAPGVDRWDEEDPDDWLDPEDPRYATRELLRELGVDGPLAAPRPPIETAAAQGIGSRYVARLVELAELAHRIGARPDPVDPPPDAAERIVAALGLHRGELSGLWLDAWILGLLDGEGAASGTDGATEASGTDGATEANTTVGCATRLRSTRPTRQLVGASRIARSRIEGLLDEEAGSGVVALLVWALDSRAWVPVTDAVETGRRRDHRFDRDDGAARALEDLEHGVAAMVEVGVLESTGQQVRLTDFGTWVVDGWLEEQFS